MFQWRIFVLLFLFIFFTFFLCKLCVCFFSFFGAFNEMVIVRMYAVYPMQALIKLSEFIQFTPSKQIDTQYTTMRRPFL